MPAFELDYADPELESRVRLSIDEVEKQLGAATESEQRFVSEAAVHLLRAGGKRFRPLVVLLAAEFGDPSAADVVPAAVVVELTHLATLYHDDVMDEATLRRGAPTANSRWGNSMAILVGDYLFAGASTVVADLGPEAVRIQAATFARLVQGQIRETLGPADDEDPLEHYLGVVADKTGALIATSALFGARMSGAAPEVEHLLTRFGEKIGSAFQLSDDVIDVASDEGDSGKTPGTDLREGVPTLPTLLARRSTDPADERLLSLLARPLTQDDEVDEALGLLRAHACVEQARAFVRREADEARAMLEDLDDVPARRAFASLCDLVVSRVG
ncbi:MAG: polyprenyl synthetase family protein [Nocardioidaceae bacterium]|nr:polyprenyl synthetase family protein [Nocardioidaceae bacterium]